jgi:hypothetical protein
VDSVDHGKRGENDRHGAEEHPDLGGHRQATVKGDHSLSIHARRHGAAVRRRRQMLISERESDQVHGEEPRSTQRGGDPVRQRRRRQRSDGQEIAREPRGVLRG